MKKVGIILLIGLTFSLYAADVVLDIAPRRQWDNSNGYCGACSIQMCGLYYGNYYSQDQIRKSVGNHEILFEDNLETAVAALSLTSVPYQKGYLDNKGYVIAASGMDAYCNWFKTEISKGNPIIYSTVHKTDNYKVSNNSYSHIVVACGYDAPDVSMYAGTDKLIWDDHYARSHLTNTFNDLRTKGNVEWQIFGTVQYGVAITGIRDVKGVCLPVRLYLDKWDEPNVSTGATAGTFKATIKVMSLTKGATYAIYRYNDRTRVPDSDFSAQAGAFADTFTAVDDTILLTDFIKSNGVALYRCVQIAPATAVFAGHAKAIQPGFSLSPVFFNSRTNTARVSISGTALSTVHARLFTLSGVEIKTDISLIMQQEKSSLVFNCQSLHHGFYIVQVLTGRTLLTKAFVLRR